MDKIYNLVATTMFGLEQVLEAELIVLGATEVKRGNRCVYFSRLSVEGWNLMMM